MSEIPADPQPDLARLLPREAFGEIIVILRGALPPPTSEEPAAQVRRDRAAMAAVASLRPENAAEGRLAAQFVAAMPGRWIASARPASGGGRPMSRANAGRRRWA